MAKLKTISAIATIVIVIVAAFAIYSALSYPQKVVNTQVSFTAGVFAKTFNFEQPFLDDKVQVQIAIQNGASLWRAQLLNGSQVIWEHSAAQGEQQSYSSAWIQLPSGNYNFTFGTVGVGSLDATVSVTSKGGFW